MRKLNEEQYQKFFEALFEAKELYKKDETMKGKTAIDKKHKVKLPTITELTEKYKIGSLEITREVSDKIREEMREQKKEPKMSFFGKLFKRRN